MLWVRKPTLLQRLQRELETVREERIHATAKVAMWRAQEQFKTNELSRLEAEIELLIAYAEVVAVASAVQATEGGVPHTR